MNGEGSGRLSFADGQPIQFLAALPMTLIAGLFGLVIVWVIVMDILIKLHF